MGRAKWVVVSMVLGGLSSSFAGVHQGVQGVQGKAQAQVREYLDGLRASMGLSEDSTFSKGETQVVGDHFCSRHQQLLQNQEIIGTHALICFSPTGDVTEKDAAVCGADCLAKRAVSRFSDEEVSRSATKQMKNALAADYLGLHLTKSPFVNVLSSKIRSAWMQDVETQGVRGTYVVEFTTAESPGTFVAYVDGTNGSLVNYEYRLWTAEGTANVYLRDQATTPNLKEVTLKDLVKIDRLENPFFSILNEDGTAATSAEGNYVFEASDTHFAEAQVYFALQTELNRLKDYKYEPWGAIPVVVHYGTNYNNAFYDGSKIAIGDGDGKVLLNLSKDNTVVTHEYGHSIIDHLAHIKMFPFQLGDIMGQGGAIHEGHADYFACSVYNKPTLGEGVMPDGKPMRRCDLNLPFSDRNGEVHQAGQIWSGALWEVRQKVGAALVDVMAVDALMRLKPSGFMGTAKMVDMYAAVVASDKALNGGENVKAINEVFAKRGFTKAGDGTDRTPGQPKWPRLPKFPWPWPKSAPVVASVSR